MSLVSTKERRCISYATATSYPIKELTKALRSSYETSLFRDVLFVSVGKDLERIDNGAFLFPYGVIVMWGLSTDEESTLLSAIRPFEQGSLDVPEREAAVYVYTGDTVAIIDGKIHIPSTDLDVRLSISHGFAQSVKMNVFELILKKTVQLTKSIPEHLAKSGHIPFSKKAIRQKMGELFLARSSINLHFDVLDVPEYFWDHSDLEPIYMTIANYLELDSRLEVLNQRLDVIHDLFEMLGNELNHQHSSSLEWIIISLIVIEVIISVFGHIHQACL